MWEVDDVSKKGDCSTTLLVSKALQGNKILSLPAASVNNKKGSCGSLINYSDLPITFQHFENHFPSLDAATLSEPVK